MRMGLRQWFAILIIGYLKKISCNGLVDFLELRGVVKSIETVGDKRSNHGIITNDPFMDSSHFWPFDSSLSILTTDLISGQKSLLLNGARIVKTEKEKYLSTEADGAYVICGDFKDTCFSNLKKCIMGGMTISFWLKIQSRNYRTNEDQYIISSGAQSLNSTGFAFLNFHGTYAAIWSDDIREWDMRINASTIPFDERVNIAFMWDGKSDALNFYMNGIKMQSVNGEKTKRTKNYYTFLTIGRPNNARDKRYMMPLQMSYLALWDRALKPSQIKLIYNNVDDVFKNQKF